MSIPVELAELAKTLQQYEFAYLVTIGDGGCAHVVAVSPELESDALTVAEVGRHTRANATARPGVTLVWPPRVRGDYSLIVDGTVETRPLPADGTADASAGLRVRPSRAVLHRPAPRPGTGDEAGCVSDCVELPVVPTSAT